MAKTYVEVLSGASSLEASGKEGYAIEYLFLARKNWNKTQWLLHMREEISSSDEAMIKRFSQTDGEHSSSVLAGL